LTSFTDVNSQKKKENIPKPYLKTVLSNFNYDNFTFNKRWELFADDLDEIYDDNSIEDPYNLSIRFYNKVFIFRKKTPFLNIKFDAVFLMMDKYSFSTRLRFIKKFKSSEDCYEFYKIFQNKYFVYEKNNSAFDISDCKTADKHFSVYTDDHMFVIEIKDFATTYQESLLAQYDYLNLTKEFKEIDDENSFRGFKFGTLQSEVKQIVKFKDLEYNTPFELLTDQLKYAYWKGIYFENLTTFYFSKKKRLAEVSLAYKYTNRREFDDFVVKIRKILGANHFVDEKIGFEYWIGKNIQIVLPLKYDEVDSSYKFIYLFIISNKHKSIIEKDF
jgi:hypothetical protein